MERLFCMAIAIVLASCVSHAERAKVAKLEAEVSSLKKHTATLQTNQQAIVQTTVKTFTDMWRPLLETRLVDDDLKPILNWWCFNDGGCFRTQSDCENSLVYLRTELRKKYPHLSRADAEKAVCRPQRIAYCMEVAGSTFCLAKRSGCQVQLDSRYPELALYSKTCLGVE